MANELNAYSEPLMVAAGTGIVAVVGSEVLFPLAMMYPFETIAAIGVADGAYGGTPPIDVESSIGTLLNQFGILP